MPSSPPHDESRTAQDLPVEGQTDWAHLETMKGDEAYQSSLADPDNPPLTDDQLARMRPVPNPRAIRERLGLTQRECAKRFEIALGTLRDWEQGARRPDSAAKAYLRVIEKNPEAVLRVLEAPATESPATINRHIHTG